MSRAYEDKPATVQSVSGNAGSDADHHEAVSRTPQAAVGHGGTPLDVGRRALALQADGVAGGDRADSDHRPDQSSFAGPTKPEDIVATPDFKKLRVGDRYTQIFKASDRGNEPWAVTSEFGLTDILNHETITGPTWKGTIEGKRPNLETIHATKGTAQQHVSLEVTLDASKIESTRIHEPAGFEDADGKTLYVNDRLRLETTLDCGKYATVAAKLAPTDGVLDSATATIVDRKLTIETRALKEGDLQPRLAIEVNGQDSGRMFCAPKVSVVPALAGPKDVRRVRTKDIDAAVLLLGTEVNALLLAQKEGILDAKDAILRKRVSESMSFWAKAALFFAEAVISFATAGIGARLGGAFASWAAGNKDVLDGIPGFDLEAGFATAIEDSLKDNAKAALARSSEKDGTTLAEAVAVDILCDSLSHAYEGAANNQQADWINNFEGFKQLEAKHPGAGLSAVEAHRRMIAADQDRARLDAASATVREWLRMLAQSTHGTTPMYGSKAGPEGTNLGTYGRGQMLVSVGYDGDHPDQPVTTGSVIFTGIEDPTLLLKAGGRVIDLGVPYEAACGRAFRIGRNEIGDIWVSLTSGAMGIDADWAEGPKHYLFEKGTGRKSWKDDAELEAGMQAGAKLILETEVGQLDIGTLQVGSDR